MSRVTSGMIGFMVGGGLALLAFEVWLASKGIGAEDVVHYLQLLFGLPVGLFGGVIGAVIGAGIGGKAQ
jgi:hypothetical protein